MTSATHIAALLNLPPRISRRDAETAIATSIAVGAQGPDCDAPNAARIVAYLDDGYVLSLLEYDDGSGCGWRYDHPCDAPRPPTPILTLRLTDDGCVSVTGTAADILAWIGRTLYGSHWQAPLARDVGVNPNTIGRWMTSKTPLPADHGVFIDVLQRLAEIRRAHDMLAAWIFSAHQARPV